MSVWVWLSRSCRRYSRNSSSLFEAFAMFACSFFFGNGLGEKAITEALDFALNRGLH